MFEMSRIVNQEAGWEAPAEHTYPSVPTPS